MVVLIQYDYITVQSLVANKKNEVYNEQYDEYNSKIMNRTEGLMSNDGLNISEKDGVITLSSAKATTNSNVTTIWYDYNCPFCRRHWIQNLDSYISDIDAGRLTLHMIPVAFLTEYSAAAAMFAYSVVPYGAALFLDVFHSLVWEGLPESQGDDDALVKQKLDEVRRDILVPALTAKGIDPKTVNTTTQEDYDKVKANTKRAAANGVDSVPHVVEG